MLTRLPLALACLCLASCALTSARPPVPPPCDAPVTLPETALDDRQIEILWGRDRTALRICGARLAAATR